jgi:hypothetical protein
VLFRTPIIMLLALSSGGGELNGGWSWAVPGMLEPEFNVSECSYLPLSAFDGTHTFANVVEVVRGTYQLTPDEAEVSLESEQRVHSSGKCFWRVTLRTTVFRTEHMHGYCGQHIYVWIGGEGAISGVYGGRGFCPI